MVVSSTRLLQQDGRPTSAHVKMCSWMVIRTSSYQEWVLRVDGRHQEEEEGMVRQWVVGVLLQVV